MSIFHKCLLVISSHVIKYLSCRLERHLTIFSGSSITDYLKGMVIWFIKSTKIALLQLIEHYIPNVIVLVDFICCVAEIISKLVK